MFTVKALLPLEHSSSFSWGYNQRVVVIPGLSEDTRFTSKPERGSLPFKYQPRSFFPTGWTVQLP